MLQRPRRNRKSTAIRDLVRETRLHPEQLIFPLFILPEDSASSEIESMPGIFRLGEKELISEVEECRQMGIKTIVLFPAIPDSLKDKTASYGVSENNFYHHRIRMLKEKFPDISIMTDVALDPYSSDGHDGILEKGRILNDESLPILAEMAFQQAKAGADIIGPSDMMDGRVGVIREKLDHEGFTQTSIMSYTAKYASAFYGPFRDALDSTPRSGDKKTYQMDPANRDEAVREALLDEAEGADILMVKPALSYLDVISDLKAVSELPVAAYNVSGEYSMVKAAAERGWIDGEGIMLETLLSMRRAGADIILTYFAKEYAQNYV